MHDEEIIKKFMYVNRRPPHGTIYAQESLEVVLIGAAFDQDVSVAFVDDGIYQLVKEQETGKAEIKNFSRAYRALEDYDVEKLYVEQESLASRGIGEEDLIVDVEVKSAEELKTLMEEQDILLTF